MLQKLAVAVAAASALLAFTTAPAAASVDDFIGMWTNTDTGTDNITRISVTRAGRGGRGGPQVQVWGQCHPTDCDWGTVEARPYAPTAGGDAYRDANVLIAQFDTGSSHQTVILRLQRDGVRYETFTEFTDRSRRSNYFVQGNMRRLGIVPFPRPGGGGFPGPGGYPGPGGGGGGGGGGASLPAQDCVGFANGRLTVEPAGGGSYRVVDGSHSIMALDNASEANSAVRVIQHYGFTQQCFIMRPDASMTYWTRSGNPPRTRLPGDDCISVNPSNVQVQNVSGAWKVVDGRNWLLDFASNRAGAEAARDTIRYYRMNQMCFVGRSGRSMMYWLAE